MDKSIKPVTLLKALMMGIELEITGYRVSLQDTVDGEKILCYRADCFKDGFAQDDKYIAFPMGIDDFVNWAMKLPDEQYMAIAGSIALTEVKRGKIG